MRGDIIGTNKRYADKIDANMHERLANRPNPPATLPQQAFGGQPIVWSQARSSVWVWVHFDVAKVAERVKGYVKGANDRVCVVWVDGPGGGWEIVVWRNAVTHRNDEKPPPRQ